MNNYPVQDIIGTFCPVRYVCLNLSSTVEKITKYRLFLAIVQYEESGCNNFHCIPPLKNEYRINPAFEAKCDRTTALMKHCSCILEDKVPDPPPLFCIVFLPVKGFLFAHT